MSAVPSFLVAVALVFMPESPRFLLCKGREQETLTVLRNMYFTNTGKERSSYPVTGLQMERVSPHIVDHMQDWRTAVNDCLNKAAQLFSPSLYRVTLIMVMINFSIQFGYYGLWLWFPELFNKLEQYHALHPNQTVSVCEVWGYVYRTEYYTLLYRSCLLNCPPQKPTLQLLTSAPALFLTIRSS